MLRELRHDVVGVRDAVIGTFCRGLVLDVGGDVCRTELGLPVCVL